MGKHSDIRAPKQSRSKATKETIVQTALDLFCQQGFHGTTTNQIAEVAGVSIGSVYAYFQDREAILYEILDRYHERFLDLHRHAVESLDTKDLKQWLRSMIDNLVRIHRRSKSFNRELNALYYSNSKVAAIRDAQNQETRQLIVRCIRRWDS